MIDLTDTSFLILVKIDSVSRLENLNTVIRYIHKHFKTEINVLEVDDSAKFINDAGLRINYTFIYNTEKILHTTKFRNKLIEDCNTPYFVMYDTDIILPKRQILNTLQRLRKEPDLFVYPYDGRFYNVEEPSRSLFLETMDENLFIDYNTLKLLFSNSTGGVFASSKSLYKSCGLENENIVSWGPDDKERYKRLERLGVSIRRIPGPLFHLDHQRGLNSYHPFREVAIKNMQEYLKILLCTKAQLNAYILTWTWVHK